MSDAARETQPESAAAPPARATPAERFIPAWRSPGAWGLMLAVTAAGLAIDLWTKAAAFARVAGPPVRILREDVLAVGPDRLATLIPMHEPVVVAERLLHFTLVLNPGAVFGIGAGRRWFFVLFTVLALAFCLWTFGMWTRSRDRLTHIGLGLIIAGGLGNLYDRLSFACVRDFIHPLPGVRLPFGLRWPGGSPEVWPYVSNVADAFLIIGIVLLLWYSFRAPPHGQPPGASDPERVA
ncbi:MAG: signal peptidase II [Planctomycetota bacterium]